MHPSSLTGIWNCPSSCFTDVLEHRSHWCRTRIDTSHGVICQTISSSEKLKSYVICLKTHAPLLSSSSGQTLLFSQSSSWCECECVLDFAVALVLLLNLERPLVVRLGRPSWYRSPVECTEARGPPLLRCGGGQKYRLEMKAFTPLKTSQQSSIVH